MEQKIKTIIKFQRGTEGINKGKIFGFVTKQNGHWRGCRSTDECKKKIVLIGPKVPKQLLMNTPYNVTLEPMFSENGFIAISATPIKFDGKIITKVNKGEFKVICKFGMKTIMYDPTSNNKKHTCINDIANIIRHRVDLPPQQVAEDFVDSACLVKSMYNRCS